MAEPSRAPEAQVFAPGAHFLIVEARFYDAIGALQLEGATAALQKAGASWTLVQAPGALEIPAAIAILLDAAQAAGKAYDGAIALGCVVRGETYHFEIVAGESARALMDLSVSRKIALGNGILTTENEDQAFERADPQKLDKGGDAARAALKMHQLKKDAR